MTRVLVEEVLLSKLNNLTQPLELCDKSGRVLGQVFPALNVSGYDLWEPPISEEELQRREQETESDSMAEVLAYLEGLGCPESGGKSPQ